MPERSPKHRLTRGKRGWYKRVAGDVRWVCSDKQAPTGELADEIFEEKFQELCQPSKLSSEMTVQDMFELIVTRKREAAEAGNRSLRTVGDYVDVGSRLVGVIGHVRADSADRRHFLAFARAIEAFSPSRRQKMVNLVRGTFRWAFEGGLIPKVPDFGPDLRGPSKAEFRRHKAKRGELLYSALEIANLLGKADSQFKAMILLALNGGMGNTDLSSLPRASHRPKDRVIRFPRGKTGIERTIPLWRECNAALLEQPDRGELMFLHRDGRPWIMDNRSHHDRIAGAFGELCTAAGVPNRGFYSLRRTFRTLADECGDQRAAAAIMGHEINDTGGIYVQRIEVGRLKKITAHVRASVLSVWSQARGRDKTAGGKGGRRASGKRGRKSKPAKPRG